MAGMLLSIAHAGPLAAQEASQEQDKKDDKVTELERIQVTGSNIKRTDTETASPLQIVTAKDIENMGARTLLQVLDNLPAARPAQVDSKSLFTGSDGASQANLVGKDSDHFAPSLRQRGPRDPGTTIATVQRIAAGLDRLMARSARDVEKDVATHARVAAVRQPFSKGRGRDFRVREYRPWSRSAARGVIVRVLAHFFGRGRCVAW